jgi:ABC-type phosphate/phosphonate transport system substrate-binding protein
MLNNPLFSKSLFCLLWLFLSSTMAAAETTSHPSILVGGSADALHDSTITDAEIAIRLIFNEMLASIDESFTIKIYESNDDLVQDFKDGKIDAIYTYSLGFLELDELIHPTARYVVQYGTSIKQRYLILVRREDHHIRLSELRNHKASLATSYFVGKRFLDVKLLQQGLPVSENFFYEIDLVSEANTAVVDLFFGKVDVAVVPENSYELACELNPQLRASLVVLDSSEPMICDAVGMRYDFPQSRIERIAPYVLRKGPKGRLKHLLETFRIEGLYRMDNDTMKEVKKLDETYRALTHQSP